MIQKASQTRALLLLFMVKALCSHENFGDATRCWEIASGVFEKFESPSPSKVYESCVEILMTTEFEMVLSLMKRTLACFGRFLKEHHLEGKQGWRGCSL